MTSEIFIIIIFLVVHVVTYLHECMQIKIQKRDVGFFEYHSEGQFIKITPTTIPFPLVPASRPSPTNIFGESLHVYRYTRFIDYRYGSFVSQQIIIIDLLELLGTFSGPRIITICASDMNLAERERQR